MFMFFKTCEHYDVENMKGSQTNYIIECFICYDQKDINNNSCIKLNRQKCYIKSCECDLHLHLSCLTRWHSINKSCPICRCKMIKHETNLFLYSFLHNVCIYSREKSRYVFRFCFLIFSLYCYLHHVQCIIEFVKILHYIELISKTKYYNYDNDSYQTMYISSFESLD